MFLNINSFSLIENCYLDLMCLFTNHLHSVAYTVKTIINFEILNVLSSLGAARMS